MTPITATPISVATQPVLSQPHTRTGPIVVAVGGNDAVSVLRAASHLASVSTSSLLVVSVLEPLPAYFGSEMPALLPPQYDSERIDARRERLQQQVVEVLGTSLDARVEVRLGEPAYVLTEIASEHQSPLIVMGIGRHRPIDRLLGGETTLRAIRRAHCPVLAVGGDFNPPFREVAIATDFSAASAKAAESVIPLLAPDAAVHLLHVWQPRAVDDARLTSLDEAYVEALPARFARMREMLALPVGVTLDEEIREGKVAERVLDFAAAHHVDLIVAGRQGLNVFARLTVGSVTTALLRGASSSLLIATEPAFPEVDRYRRLLDGTSESYKPAEWMIQLDEFTRRNRGRRTTLEVDDLSLGAQVLESGYTLQGATYDPSDRRVEVMLGDAGASLRHVTRSVGNVESVAIATDAHGNDVALRISHERGQTVLTFSPR